MQGPDAKGRNAKAGEGGPGHARHEEGQRSQRRGSDERRDSPVPVPVIRALGHSGYHLRWDSRVPCWNATACLGFCYSTDPAGVGASDKPWVAGIDAMFLSVGGYPYV